ALCYTVNTPVNRKLEEDSMQIKLGEKIKELRKRDGRKQEDLAVALGVTNQAVSRWEANGGYPDIEMLPAIANYFHITIDELFGYDNDRQTKLQSYLDQSDQMNKCGDDRVLLVEFLRNAISEFPTEWQLQRRLADALLAMGYQKYKAHAINTEGCDDIRNDMETAYKECLKEAISLYEEVLKKEIDDDARTSVTSTLLWVYSYMEDFENAERMALSQSPVRISREVLLASAAEGEKGEEYSGEAILTLMHQLYRQIECHLAKNQSLAHSQAALDTSLAVARLYESIIDDGNFGMHHNDMCMLYLRCSSAAIHLNDSERALNYLEIALDHFVAFEQTKDMRQFTAPLVSKVKKNCVFIIFKLNRELFENHMQDLPAECVDAIKNNPKYASIFAQ
ncbi:MAG: helix-turn-helix domain-containing protein, partial [Acetatifactor sp.]|nr:helix-turn-helix domain-containing protein [Acetatifactor sp.]